MCRSVTAEQKETLAQLDNPALKVNHHSSLTNIPYSCTDPQTWKEWTRARNAYEYLTTTEALCASMPEMTFPFVCFHGDIDTMTDPEGSKQLYEQSQVGWHFPLAAAILSSYSRLQQNPMSCFLLLEPGPLLEGYPIPQASSSPVLWCSSVRVSSNVYYGEYPMQDPC